MDIALISDCNVECVSDNIHDSPNAYPTYLTILVI